MSDFSVGGKKSGIRSVYARQSCFVSALSALVSDGSRPRHSPSLSNHRRDLHILLNAISVLLFGVINPLPLLQFNHPKEEMRRAKNSNDSSQKRTAAGRRRLRPRRLRWAWVSGGALLERGHALFRVPPPPLTDCCGSLKRPFLLFVCRGTDLCSLCSEITAQPSSAVLQHMKQSGLALQTHSTRGCTDRKAEALVYSINAAKSRDPGPAFKSISTR